MVVSTLREDVDDGMGVEDLLGVDTGGSTGLLGGAGGGSERVDDRDGAASFVDTTGVDVCDEETAGCEPDDLLLDILKRISK